MSMEYTYEIIKVDEAARCMEISYAAEGYQPMNIGTRLPYEGESVDDIAKMYAPLSYWVEQTALVVLPAVGTKGHITVFDISTPMQNYTSTVDGQIRENVIYVLRELGITP